LHIFFAFIIIFYLLQKQQRTLGELTMTTSRTEAFQPQPDCSYHMTWGSNYTRVSNDPEMIVKMTSEHDTSNGLRARISQLNGITTIYKVPANGYGDKVFYTATDPKAICGLINAVTQEPSRGFLNRIFSTLSCPTCRVDKEKNVAMITPSFAIASTDGEKDLIPSREIPVSKVDVLHDTYLPWSAVPGQNSRLNIDITLRNDSYRRTAIYTTDVAVPRMYSDLS
jgi:hypothetical protein